MARTPHLPAPAETVKGSFFKQGAGGKGFNQGVAAHKAGGDVAMITKLGRDSMANVALDVMTELNMPKDFLFYNDDVATGIALIMVDENSSQNEIVIVPGACGTITAEDIKSVEQRICDSAYILLQLEVNQDANAVAKLAKEHGVRVILNTAPYQPVTDEFLKGCWLVTPNEVEAEEMTGVAVTDLESANRAAKIFFEKGVENVLITLGSRGVYINTGDRAEIIPAFHVKAVDTTGAGDAFFAGTVIGLTYGKNLAQSCEIGGRGQGHLGGCPLRKRPGCPVRAAHRHDPGHADPRRDRRVPRGALICF